MVALRQPPHWSEDPFTEYFDNAHHNRFATFVNQNAQFALLHKIDLLLWDLLEKWENPKHHLELFLLFRSHSAFRVSCQNVLAGQITESYVSIRSCLEFAGYAVMILNQPDLATIWLSRHDNEASLQNVRDTFTFGKMRTSVATYCPKMANNLTTLYNLTIDFGAHPNDARSAAMHMSKS